MKVSVKKVDALRREMHFEVPKDRVTRKMDEVLNRIMKQARIPGFRKGKAPRKLVESAHASLAREEMLKGLIPEVYQEGLQSESLNPIDFPAIDQVELKDGLLKFRATFDLRPQVEVKDYKGIKVTKNSVDVTDEELDKTLEFLKKSRGMDEQAPVDDDFAKGMGFPGLEDFRKVLKRNLEIDKERQNRSEVEGQIGDALIKTSKLDVPQSLVLRQLRGRLEDFQQRLKHYGAKDGDIQKRLEGSRKELKAAAEKDVRLFLILQKIAEVESITAGEGENLMTVVMGFLLKEAKWEEAKS